MTTSENAVGGLEISYSRWYAEELPLPTSPDAASLEPGLTLIEAYTGMPQDEVRRHVKDIRDKAYAVHHYPCLGRWRFLTNYLPGHPEYQNILSRLQSGEKLLDVGCCFGQVLRQLALSGIPAENLAGVDLNEKFIDLGYELFQDRHRFNARFVVGDVLHSSPSLDPLDGQFAIIHASSFLHLFGWDDQVTIGERLVRFFKPETRTAMIVGRQVGTYQAENLEAWREEQAQGAIGMRKVYRHDLTSWQLLWDEIGVKTGTRWKTSGEFFERTADGVSTPILRFTVKKVAGRK